MVAVAIGVAAASASCTRQDAGTLQGASETLGQDDLHSIAISGTGRWFQFGQAPSPTTPWPQFDVSSYTAAINYDVPAARVEMTRLQTVEPGRVRPVPVEQRLNQYVSGAAAWNMPAAGSVPQPQPAAVEERTAEIWTTPHGFLKAAIANNATSQAANGGSEVSFAAGNNRYVGTVNAQNHVERVQTWIDNTVLGDTPVEVTFSDYRDFDGVMFPSRIVRTQGGHPVLDLTVTSVTRNPSVDITVPVEASAPAAPVVVTMEPIATGVYYVRGGSHHSVAIDQRDHIVVVEAPQHEARSAAVIAKVKETIPNKPIRYVINSHHHFDHSGGLRTYVAEGATVVTHEMNRPYYEDAWAAPRTLNPDRLAQSGSTPTFETVADKHVLTDGQRAIEVHHIAGSGHNDAFVMVYLPGEKVLIEADAYSPTADTAPPTSVNPYAVNLLENIEKLKLDVLHIAALHGPRLTTMEDLRAFVGQGPNVTR